jgi:hypothetical protein
MLPRIILVFLLSSLSWNTAFAQISEEGQHCFEWFSRLNLPDISEADYAEIWTGSDSYSSRNTLEATIIHGFILNETDTHFTALCLDLITRTFIKTAANAPDHKQVKYEDHALRTTATAILNCQNDELRSIIATGSSRLEQKAEICFIAYACWLKGEMELAAQLYERAKELSLKSYIPKETNTLQELLEIHYGKIAMWDTILQFTHSSLGLHRHGYAEVKSQTSRRALLARVERNIIHFPRSHETARAREIYSVLKQMVEEDENHPVITQEQVNQLPLQQRIEELIWQLRNQNGYQWIQPGSCDIFHTRPPKGVEDQSPAHQLASIGTPAVPALIEALTDKRFSRSVGYARHNFFNHTILTVGDCAQQILNRIAGYPIYSPTYVMNNTPYASYALTRQKVIQEWWSEYQKIGKEQILLNAISAGTNFPRPILSKLQTTAPEIIVDTLLIGLEHTQQNSILMQQYIYELSQLPKPESTHALQRLMQAHPRQRVRLEAAYTLLDEYHEDAMAALLDEWSQLERSKDRPIRIFKTTVKMLIASGDERAMRQLASNWNQRPNRERFIIIESMGALAINANWPFFSYPYMMTQPVTKEAQSIAIELLVHALEDSTSEVFRGSMSDFPYENPSIGDFALLVLSKIDQQKYTRSSNANQQQRMTERIIAANIWRKENNKTLLAWPSHE